jgi:PAS domain S-box-containing protein
MEETIHAVGPRPLSIVLIENNDADADLIVGELVAAELQLNIVRVTSKAEMRAAVTRVDAVDAVLCAYRGKGVKVWQALEVIQASGAAAPLIVVSRGLSDEQATECMRLGATDYILKDDLGRLPHALANAIDHARAERAGRELETSYRRLFENIPVAVFQTTAAGQILHANPAAVAMFRFPDLASLLATSMFDLYVEPNERRALVARLETEGHLLEFETRMRRADGAEFWFCRTVHAVRQDNDRVVVWETIGRDDTEPREARRRIRESATYLSTVIESAPEAVVRMDESGAITDWNAAAEDIFGWNRAEVIGRRVSETMFPPELREQNQHGMGRFHRDGSSTLIGRRWDTFEGLRKNGDVFPIELAVSPPIPLGDGTQFVGFVRDISERKLAAHDLAESEERLRTLLAGAPVGVVTVDTDGCFTFAGGSVFGQLGIDASSVVGLSVVDIFPRRPDFVELWTSALQHDFVTDLEFGGRTFHVRGGPVRLTPEGEVIGVRAVAFDNTERVEADRALRQSEEIFRLLFEQSAVGISLHELPQNGLPGQARWNSRMREMLGMEADSEQSSWTSVVAGGEQRAAEEEYGRLLSGEIAQLRERRMLTRPDGKTIWADLSTILVRDDDHQPVRFQTMALDITEQIGAETRLSRRAAQQTVLVELSRAGLEGHETADFLATAIELVTRGTETQFGTILEVRPSEGRLIRVAAHGYSDQMLSDPTRREFASLVLDALTSEMPVLTFDYRAQPELRLSQWMIDYGVVVSMAVGIRGPISPFGVLSVHSNVPREFSADDLQFMQLASTIISVAVERKREEKQRRLLLGRLVAAQEAERKTIAEDIHDDAVQIMTAATMRLELFRMVLTDPVQVDAAQKLQETISLAIGRLRNLLFELIPPDLDRHGLVAGFKRHLEKLKLDAGLRWDLQTELDCEPDPQVRILLFRIFQEALVNVRKHAHASTVTVSLKTVDGGVMMRLADDGAGFIGSAAEPLAGHLGLASMRERAEIAGGWWRLTTEPGHGTEILTWVPAPRQGVPTAARAGDVMAIG